MYTFEGHITIFPQLMTDWQPNTIDFDPIDNVYILKK